MTGRELYEDHQSDLATQVLGIDLPPWEELSTRTREAWEQNARDYTTKRLEDLSDQHSASE